MPDHILINSSKKREVLDITSVIEKILPSKKSGVVNLFVSHTSCAISTADLDIGTDLDMLDAFNKIIPNLKYRHPHDPTHVPDHILSSIIGPSLSVPYKNGRLLLGTWQRIILIELNGPKERKIIVNV